MPSGIGSPMKDNKHRLTQVIRETARNSITEEEIKLWVLRNVLRRMRDKDYDDKCQARFKGLSEEEIKREIKADILLDKHP
jgi:hypothetical protein